MKKRDTAPFELPSYEAIDMSSFSVVASDVAVEHPVVDERSLPVVVAIIEVIL